MTKAHRRWRFYLYQTGHDAAEKLVTDLLNGVSDRSRAVVGWGNGSLGPASCGHSTAQNKALRTMLWRHVAVVLVDEYSTSKRCSCCATTVKGQRTEHYMKRHTILRCDTCDGLLGLDMAASANIETVFIPSEGYGRPYGLLGARLGGTQTKLSGEQRRFTLSNA